MKARLKSLVPMSPKLRDIIFNKFAELELTLQVSLGVYVYRNATRAHSLITVVSAGRAPGSNLCNCPFKGRQPGPEPRPSAPSESARAGRPAQTAVARGLPGGLRDSVWAPRAAHDHAASVPSHGGEGGGVGAGVRCGVAGKGPAVSPGSCGCAASPGLLGSSARQGDRVEQAAPWLSGHGRTGRWSRWPKRRRGGAGCVTDGLRRRCRGSQAHRDSAWAAAMEPDGRGSHPAHGRASTRPRLRGATPGASRLDVATRTRGRSGEAAGCV